MLKKRYRKASDAIMKKIKEGEYFGCPRCGGLEFREHIIANIKRAEIYHTFKNARERKYWGMHASLFQQVVDMDESIVDKLLDIECLNCGKKITTQKERDTAGVWISREEQQKLLAKYPPKNTRREKRCHRKK